MSEPFPFPPRDTGISTRHTTDKKAISLHHTPASQIFSPTPPTHTTSSLHVYIWYHLTFTLFLISDALYEDAEEGGCRDVYEWSKRDKLDTCVYVLCSYLIISSGFTYLQQHKFTRLVLRVPFICVFVLSASFAKLRLQPNVDSCIIHLYFLCIS